MLAQAANARAAPFRRHPWSDAPPSSEATKGRTRASTRSAQRSPRCLLLVRGGTILPPQGALLRREIPATCLAGGGFEGGGK